MLTYRFTEAFADIAIAQQAIEDSLLTYAVADGTLLCDVYCIPSHNHQAFYVQIYGGTEYTLVYAKTYIVDPMGYESVMYTFSDVLKAEKRTGYRGDIVCGIKKVALGEGTINQLLQCLPCEDELIIGGIMIDGVQTIIRNYHTSSPVALGYHSANDIICNQLSTSQTEFMDNLYLHVEQIIGNILDTK